MLLKNAQGCLSLLRRDQFLADASFLVAVSMPLF